MVFAEDTTPDPGPSLARFGLIAGAVAGRSVLVVGSDHERGYCDGERIYAAAGDGAEVARDTLLVQAALLAAGSLDPRVVVRLAGRRRLRHRYLVLEAARAGAELGDLLPRGLTRRIEETYAGPLTSSPLESLARAGSEGDDVPEAPAWMGTIRPGRILRANPSLTAGAPTDKDVAGTSKQLEMPELDEDEDFERSKILELFQAPAMQNPLATMLQKLLGMGRTPSAEEGSGGDELPVGSQEAGPVGENAKRTDNAPPGLENVLAGPPVGRLYPEWNANTGRYREEWCAVTEYDPRPSEEEHRLEAVDDRRLRRELARLGLAQERHRRQDDGDVLDVSALIDFVADRRTGGAGDPRVYERKLRTAHDLGVLVLLDTTGSTGESDEGRRVFDEQRELAARLTAAFEELGDRTAAYGFQSWGRQRVQFLRVKGFDDRYDQAAQHRLAALEPGGFTRLGAAIRHATHLLADKAGTASTLLVVVGDGLPYDDGYEHRYAQEDCRHALEEAVVAGVACACVSVRSATEPEIMEKVWGNVPHRSLERPSELAAHVTPLFRSALKEAAASRRIIGTETHPHEVIAV